MERVDLVGESMFGKRERLYADARKQQEAPPPPAPAQPPPPPLPPPARPEPEASRSAAVDVVPGRDVRGLVSTGLELSGIAALSTGGFLVAPWLGCMMLGVLLIVLGVATGYRA